MKPIRNRYGIARWIGPRPVDDGHDWTPEPLIEHKPRKRGKGPADCGTDAGYYRHRRTLKEPACDACKTAHSAALKDLRKRKARAA